MKCTIPALRSTGDPPVTAGNLPAESRPAGRVAQRHRQVANACQVKHTFLGFCFSDGFVRNQTLGFLNLFSFIFSRFFENFLAALLSEGPFMAAGGSVGREEEENETK